MAVSKNLKEELKKYLANKALEEKKKAIIVSAYKMSNEEIAQVADKFKVLKNLNVRNTVDTGIIGGMIIKYSTKVIDLSLLGQLNKIKKILYEIN